MDKTRATEKPLELELEPIQELEGFDMEGSDAFMCDMETGICGPVNEKKESK